MDIGGGVGSWVAQAAQDARQDLWSERAYWQHGKDKQDAQEEAKRNRQFQLDMMNNRYQMQVQDMIKAGLNPMLSVSQGAPGPSGGSMAPMPGAPRPTITKDFSAFSAVAGASLIKSQQELLAAQADNVRADTEVKREQPGQIRQQVAESVQRVQTLAATAGREVASATNLAQQTVNLKEEVPKIRETVRLLGAQTLQSLAAAGLSKEQAAEVHQRIKANLPDLNKALAELEVKLKNLAVPGAQNQAMVQDSYLGVLSQYIRALIPINNLLR